MSLELNPAGDYPQVSSTAYVHPSATLIGRVIIEDRVFIGPHAVIRADEPTSDGTVVPIAIGEGANIQDCVVIHALGGTGVTIGPKSSIAHAAVIHGPCEIGLGCFVGFNSVVFRATLGDGAIVMHQALVDGVVVPKGLSIPSMTCVCHPEDVYRLSRATPDMNAFVQQVCETNIQLAQAMLKNKKGASGTLPYGCEVTRPGA